VTPRQPRPPVGRLAAACAAVAWVAIAAPGLADAAAPDPEVRIAPPSEAGRIGRDIPDVLLTTAGGVTRLSEAGRGRPIVLGFVFTRCAGVCSPFLRSWLAADRRLGGRDDVTRVVVSFDPRDTLDDMTGLAAHTGATAGDEDWVFGVAAPDDIRRLAEAVGFWWTWDAGRRQFDHPALLAGLRDGRLARLLVGGTITAVRLDELRRDLTGAPVQTYPLPGRVLFRCFDFDSTSGRLRLDWGFAVLLLPGLVVGAATAGLFTAGARTRRIGGRR